MKDGALIDSQIRDVAASLVLAQRGLRFRKSFPPGIKIQRVSSAKIRSVSDSSWVLARLEKVGETLCHLRQGETSWICSSAPALS